MSATETVLFVLTLVTCAGVIVWTLMPRYRSFEDVMRELLAGLEDGTITLTPPDDIRSL